MVSKPRDDCELMARTFLKFVGEPLRTPHSNNFALSIR